MDGHCKSWTMLIQSMTKFHFGGCKTNEIDGPNQLEKSKKKFEVLNFTKRNH
jgi:hypothetical protein